jgi:alkane 1-monooxygenase
MSSEGVRMIRSLQHVSLFTVPLAVSMGILWGGAWTFFTPFYLFVLIPALDHMGGLDTSNPEQSKDSKSKDKGLYELWLKLWVPAQLAVMGWALFHVTQHALQTYEIIGLTLSVGMMASSGGINVAHEFMHRKNPFERALAEILMTSVSYTHFCIEHVLGHHKFVGTPKDPATSKKDESIYAFLPRTFFGGIHSAWQLESARIQQRQLGWSLKDRRIRYSLIYAIVLGSILGAFGGLGCLFFIGQSLMAILFLEIINYVEHYGLTRKQLDHGRYERVAPKHSWNSAHRLTNALLLNLPRHADHHYLASRPYQLLRHIEESPQLPTGYAAMLLLALVPPLWKKVMNPKVDEWNQRVLNTELS